MNTRNKTYIDELINSGVSLSKNEAQMVEEYLLSKQQPVNPSHLNHYKSVAAVRGKGSDKQ